MLKEYFLNKLKEGYVCNFNKYDYSLVPNEFKSIDKIKIICNVHGVFEQRVNNHLQGNDCKKCAIENTAKSQRSNKTDFITKAKLIHGTKYDYDKVNYINAYTKIVITCKEHGDFEQTPTNHLQGQGCLKCANYHKYNLLKSNKTDFITKANIIHNNKYDYSKVDYINAHTKIVITCPIHGDYIQSPNSHLNGSGCLKCNIDYKKSNTEDFISKSQVIHNNKYKYDKVNYLNAHTKVIISCLKHGDFKQRPNGHLKGYGCFKCRESTGEKHISTILDNLNIQYIREYKILGYNYRYDFYLPEYNIYIEYHGRQHYIPISIFGGKKSFNKIKRRDKTKIELIKRSNGLLIILYYKLNTLELIRDEIINIFNLLNPKYLENKEFTKDYINNSKVYLYNKGIMHIRK